MTPRIKEIAAFMTERQNIYLKRKAGHEGPWTNDPILQKGRFCNIFRENDKVTIWVRENIRERFKDHPYLWFMLCIARYINWPPTLQFLIETAEKQKIACWPSHPNFDCGVNFIQDGDKTLKSSLTWALSKLASTGAKVYTGAYMIRAESNSNAEWYSWSKHAYICEIVLGRLWEDREQWTAMLEDQVDGGMSLEDCWALFQNPRYIGWGPFMAYEVVTDLRHTRYLENAPDIYTWANAGPGAIRGLNRLYGRDLNAKPKPEQTNLEMMDLMANLNVYNDSEFVSVFGAWKYIPHRFEMRDIEHTLCEFDKYERVRLGEGKMRSKFDWRKAGESF